MSGGSHDSCARLIATLENRLERLWKLVNGNGDVGVWEVLRTLQASVDQLHDKVDTLARHEDLERIRHRYEAHEQAEYTIVAMAKTIQRLSPAWRWLLALAGTALASGGLGAWLAW